MTTSTKIQPMKKASDQAKVALYILLAKYGADEHTINCESMSEVDYEIYIALDNCIRALVEATQAEFIAANEKIRPLPPRRHDRRRLNDDR